MGETISQTVPITASHRRTTGFCGTLVDKISFRGRFGKGARNSDFRELDRRSGGQLGAEELSGLAEGSDRRRDLNG
jgi:hypothetical protein